MVNHPVLYYILNVFAHLIISLEALGNLIYQSTKEKGIAYTAGYLGTELMSGAAIAQVCKLGKLGKLGKLSGVTDDIADVSKAGKIVNKDRKLGQIIEKWYSKGKSKGSKKAVGKGGTDVWDMTEGGGIINGREYSQHAMERMAPDTPSVRAKLSRRAEELAESKGLQVGTPEYHRFCQEYVDPRNIPPSVIEDAIRNTTAVPGHTAGTFVHQTADVTVIVNETGKVITVIPK